MSPLSAPATTVVRDGYWPPPNTARRWRHDPRDNRVESRDANGNLVEASFDLLDRRTEVRVTPGPGVSAETNDAARVDRREVACEGFCRWGSAGLLR